MKRTLEAGLVLSSLVSDFQWPLGRGAGTGKGNACQGGPGSFLLGAGEARACLALSLTRMAEVAASLPARSLMLRATADRSPEILGQPHWQRRSLGPPPGPLRSPRAPEVPKGPGAPRGALPGHGRFRLGVTKLQAASGFGLL